MKRESPKPPPPEEREAEREALIDEILEGTFPASDPPNWDGVSDVTEPEEKPTDPGAPTLP